MNCPTLLLLRAPAAIALAGLAHRQHGKLPAFTLATRAGKLPTVIHKCIA